VSSSDPAPPMLLRCDFAAGASRVAVAAAIGDTWHFCLWPPCFQWTFWHAAEQYFTPLHLAHRCNPGSVHPSLAHLSMPTPATPWPDIACGTSSYVWGECATRGHRYPTGKSKLRMRTVLFCAVPECMAIDETKVLAVSPRSKLWPCGPSWRLGVPRQLAEKQNACHARRAAVWPLISISDCRTHSVQVCN
jgi:hypothetical protein